jgi:hypothetical protein
VVFSPLVASFMKPGKKLNVASMIN